MNFPRRPCGWVSGIWLLLVLAATAGTAFAQNARITEPALERQAGERMEETNGILIPSPTEQLLLPLARIARDLTGIHYRLGGNSVESGLDCSGLVRVIWAKLGLTTLPRTSAAMAKIGEKVEADDLEPGDLVFFNTRGRPNSHVGVYIGLGRFIHASSVRRKVMENALDESYYKSRFNGARRLANPQADMRPAGLSPD